MTNRNFRFLGLVSLFFLVHPGNLSCQERKNSPAFKSYRRIEPSSMVKQSDLTYQLWEGYMLMKNANAGEPASQHELGLRYLLGKGFPFDTLRAAFWVLKAAQREMAAAKFNIGIFYNNGWGVPWDPFEAYRQFEATAETGMPEAEYVFGVFHTDGLVVPRNYAVAYRWFSKSARSGYKPALSAMKEMEVAGILDTLGSNSEKKSSQSRLDSSEIAAASSEPILFNFDADTAGMLNDMRLLKEAFRESNVELRQAFGISKAFSSGDPTDSSVITTFYTAAENGNPEALTVLGRCYENGIGVKKDILLAAEYYIRAAHLDVRRPVGALLRLLGKKEFVQLLDRKWGSGDIHAQYAAAGIRALGFDNRLGEPEALQSLLAASQKNHLPSMVELGICYSTGRWTALDKEKAVLWWNKAASMGSEEAGIRIAAWNVMRVPPENIDSSLAVIDRAVRNGSVLAEVALAYAYEKGIGVPRSTAEAVRLYRQCGYRGNLTAFQALKELYDSIRPDDIKFEIN